MKFRSSRFVIFTQWCYLCFIFLLFLSLGVDRGGLDQFRMFTGAGLIVFFLVSYRSNTGDCLKSAAFIFLIGMGGYLLLRAVYGAGMNWLGGITDAESQMYQRYLLSPIPWFISTGIFGASYLFVRDRTSSLRVFWVFSWASFFIAINAIPPLLGKSPMGYPIGESRVFFHPTFYPWQWVKQWLISDFAHVNYIGDIIAIGLLSSAALFTYSFITWQGLRKSGHPAHFPFTQMGRSLAVICPCALAIVLFFSRGSILCFSFGLFVFFFLYIIKYRSLSNFVAVGIVVTVMSAALFWAGNLSGVWKELSTLSLEVENISEGSSGTNVEGAKRAIRMFRESPFLGVGTGGYEALSQQYASEGKDAPFLLAKFYAMCHYLQVLAEEGMVGAAFYCLFLAAYILSFLKNYFYSQSRFQSIMSLGLFSASAVILSHAVFNHLLEQFNMTVLVCSVMGSCLGMVRPDFMPDRK